MSFSVPYKVETTSNDAASGVASSSGDNNDWQTTTVTTVIPSQASNSPMHLSKTSRKISEAYSRGNRVSLYLKILQKLEWRYNLISNLV